MKGGENMKGITVLIVAIMGIAIVGMFGAVAAADRSIETELRVSGNGSFSRDMGAQTEMGYAGKRLTETYYTRYMGTDGNSQLEYASSLEMYMGNSTELEDETVTEIAYAQTAVSTNAKQLVCSSNYDIGVSQGFSANGPFLAKSFESVMDDHISEFEMEAKVLGRIRLMQDVVDPESRLKYEYEDTQLEGQYDLEWSAYAEDLSYPEGEEPWLGCP
jgi:hypothetical protein